MLASSISSGGEVVQESCSIIDDDLDLFTKSSEKPISTAFPSDTYYRTGCCVLLFDNCSPTRPQFGWLSGWVTLSGGVIYARSKSSGAMLQVSRRERTQRERLASGWWRFECSLGG